MNQNLTGAGSRTQRGGSVPRVYSQFDVVGFRRNRDPAGALSNMFAMPAALAGIAAPSSEALYQALRFPELPDHQAAILAAPNAFLAKQAAYQRIGEQRTDWSAGRQVRVNCMRLALRAKLAHQENRPRLLAILAASRGRPIVEISVKDGVWGAIPDGHGKLIGLNMLGRLWMEIRERLAEDPLFPQHCDLAEIPDLYLLGRKIPYPYDFPTIAPVAVPGDCSHMNPFR